MKLVLMMFFLSLTLIGILVGLYASAEKSMIELIKKQTEDLSTAIQVSVEELTSKGTDEAKLAAYLRMLKAKGIKEISIVSNEQEVIASSNPKKIGARIDPRKKEFMIKAQIGESTPKEKQKVYNIILPVVAGDEQFGYIHITMLLDDLANIIKSNNIKRLVATLIIFSLGMVLSLFLAWKYTKPIQHVVDAAKRVAAGDLSQNLPVDRKDEIGQLTASFNYMVERLRMQKELEDRLRKAEQLSAIGQLASGIAHEIRNPLNFISLSIDHLKGKYPPLEEDKHKEFVSLIDGVKYEVHRLNRMIEEFLSYGRPLKINRQVVDMAIIVEDVICLVAMKANEQGIEIAKDVSSIQAFVDPELMRTCLLNIFLNAFQAMPDGGKMFISARNSDGTFSIEVSDTGHGIAQEDIGRIFEPYFTTKKIGIGLGLAITKRIVEEHSGTITVHSSVEEGTRVIISLPIEGNA